MVAGGWRVRGIEVWFWGREMRGLRKEELGFLRLEEQRESERGVRDVCGLLRRWDVGDARCSW